MTEPDNSLRCATVEEARYFEPGAHHYRAYVGSPRAYDLTSATQFTLMVSLGLREKHTLLDIGCGSLCGGRLFIPYLLPGNYFGIEPHSWLVEDGVRFEVTDELVRLKRPRFRFSADFSLMEFNTVFDFMLAQSILTHVSRSQLNRCLSQVKLALKPTGLFAASFFYNGAETYSGENWVYPSFASYPPMLVIDEAAKLGLKAHPLVWQSNYTHYWMVFAHDSNSKAVSWLGEVGEPKMLRILQLMRELSESSRRCVEMEERLKEANQELAKLREEKAKVAGSAP